MIEEFLNSLQRKGRKRATLEQYRNALSQFDTYLIEGGFSLFTADTDTIMSYYTMVKQKGWASSTCYKRSQAVFAFYEWLYESGRLLLNPAPPPMRKRGDALPRQVPAVDEIRQAYTVLYNSSKLTDQRDAVLLDLAYSCGIRREELQRLNVQNVDFYTGTIRIWGKGDRERMVPVGELTLRNVEYYLLFVRPKLAPERRTKALFVSWQQGGKRMHKGSISRLFARIRKSYDLCKKLTPHALRHAFATDLLTNGAVLQDVSKMLGHKRLETTQIYTRLAPVDLKKQHKRFHPRG